jgi:hypothetical protein
MKKPPRLTWYVKRRGPRWVVIRGDGLHAESLHDRREDAIARASEICQRVGGTLRIKGQDSRVEEEIAFDAPNATATPPGTPGR